MTNRITESILQNEVKELARITGKPFGEWNVIGSLMISGAYGGVQLQEVVSEGGGIKNLTSGYISKRELYNIVRGWRLPSANGSKQNRHNVILPDERRGAK